MIIVLKPGLARKQETTILNEIRKRGYQPHVMRGVARIVIGAIGDELTHQSLETLAMAYPDIVESVTPVQKRYKLVSREVGEEVQALGAYHFVAKPFKTKEFLRLVGEASASAA